MNKSRKAFSLLALLAVLLLVAAFAGGAAYQRDSGPSLWQSAASSSYDLPLAHDSTRTSYLVPPNIRAEEQFVRGGVPLGATAEEVAALAAENSPHGLGKVTFGPDPQAYRRLLEREKALLRGEVTKDAFGDDEFLGQPDKGYLAVMVEYGQESTFMRNYPVDPEDPSQGCSMQEFTFGPLSFGDDPPPEEWDNFSFYKEDISVDDYRSAIFGTGPDAGYGVVRPDRGGVDLSGYSLNNYLLQMNPPDAPYTTSGDILPDVIVLPNAHEYYGAAVYSEDEDGNCVSPTFSDARYSEHRNEVVASITAQYDGDASIDWSEFDADDDHVVDLLAIIHAGNGFQNSNDEDRLSTSSGSYPEPVQVVGFLTPDDDSDDYFVQGYNVNPEHLDVGAIQEEFEHQFGIPDFYSTDMSNSNAWWTSHSSGAWGGELGGTRPMGTGLYASWILGRKDPVVLEWNDPQLLQDGGLTLELGRARLTPEDMEDGVIVRLPQGSIEVENLAGEGVGWWSDSGDMMDNRVYRDFDLTGATGQVVFSFDASWNIEEDWDYGLIQFSTDGGVTWEWPQDMDGVLTDEDLNNDVVKPGERWGLTGEGEGTLRWDVSGYKGETLTVMIRYLTDPGVSNPGFWVDNMMLVDGSGTLYENDLEEDFSDWTNEGWVVVPFTSIFERYYLMEYRVANGFDQSLNNPYWFNYFEGASGHVDRLPATDQVVIVSYRDQSQGFDYTLGDSTIAPPAVGAKYGHLVVDSHPWPQMWSIPDPARDDLVGRNMSGRVMPGDAGFGHNFTEAWTASTDYDPATDTASGTEHWPGRSGVQAFHDSYGYTPGWFFSPDTGFVYLWDEAASAVLPAKDVYSTPITDVDGNPIEAFYGFTVGGLPLGTGNPGDDHVHYGLHMEVLRSDEMSATVRIWNKPYEARMEVKTAVDGTTSFYVAENIGGRLEMPFLVVELPDNVAYVEDSAFGGFMPYDAMSAEAALDAARSGAQPASGTAVKYLVWSGDDIGTGVKAELGGFQVEQTGPGNVEYGYKLYREGNQFVQEGTVTASAGGPHVLLPVVHR